MAWLSSETLIDAAEAGVLVSAPTIDMIAEAFAVLMVILATAKLGALAFDKLRRPPILGELLAGVALGLWWSRDEGSRAEEIGVHLGLIKHLAWLGGLLVFFAIGLSSRARDLRDLTLGSFLAAALGAFLSMFLGIGAALLLGGAGGFPETAQGGIALGLAMAVSSIGVTRAVIRASDRHGALERFSRAAVLVNDFLALLFLSWLFALGHGQVERIAWQSQASALGATAAVVAGALLIGGVAMPRLHRWWQPLRADAVFIVGVLALVLGAALLTRAVGLSLFVGAYALGVILTEVKLGGDAARSVRELTEPVTQFLAPFAWVWVGLHALPSRLLDGESWALAGILLVIATGSKAAACASVRASDGGRLAVFVTLMPRCTASLIFLWLTLEKGWITRDQLTAGLVVVLVTTMIAPSALARVLARRTSSPDTDAPASVHSGLEAASSV